MNKTVFCQTPGCMCYPFVCFKCKVCKDNWWVHNKEGESTPDICGKCYLAERRLTEQTLKYAVKTGHIIWQSDEWWEVFTKGVNPELNCVHSNEYREVDPEIIRVVCRKQVPYLACSAAEIKNKNWEAYRIRRERKGRSPEDYDCFREDGIPCCSKQRSRQRRQRRKEVVGN